MSTETTQPNFRIYAYQGLGYYWSDDRLLAEVETAEEVLPRAKALLRAPADRPLFFHPVFFHENERVQNRFLLSGLRYDSGGQEICVQVECLAGEIPESLQPR